MNIYDWPASLGIRTIKWTLDSPSQALVSAYTGKRTVQATPWHGKWTASVQLAQIVGEDQVRALRVLIAQLKGRTNAVRVPVTEGLQKNLPAATVGTTAAKGATTMTLAGCLLKPGHLFTVNDELKQVESVSGYDVTFWPMLRAQASSGTAVKVGDPTCLMALTDSMAGWGVDPGKVYSSSLDFEEVI